MKPKWVLLIAVVSIPLLVYLAPFWLLLPASFLIGFLLKGESSSGFLFLSLFIVFVLYFGWQASIINAANDGILVERVSKIFSVRPGFLPWISAAIMAITISTFAWSGSLMRKALVKNNT